MKKGPHEIMKDIIVYRSLGHRLLFAVFQDNVIITGRIRVHFYDILNENYSAL